MPSAEAMKLMKREEKENLYHSFMLSHDVAVRNGDADTAADYERKLLELVSLLDLGTEDVQAFKQSYSENMVEI